MPGFLREVRLDARGARAGPLAGIGDEQRGLRPRGFIFPTQLEVGAVAGLALKALAIQVSVSWSVSGQDGQLLRGSGDRLRNWRGQLIEGYLNPDVAVGQDVYTLRGPFVRMN